MYDSSGSGLLHLFEQRIENHLKSLKSYYRSSGILPLSEIVGLVQEYRVLAGLSENIGNFRKIKEYKGEMAKWLAVYSRYI